MQFRTYDPAIGRFWQTDPLAEFVPDWTPYRFGFNNPVIYSDFLGLMEEGDITGKKKKKVKGEEVERSLNGREIRIGYAESGSSSNSNANSGYYIVVGRSYSGGVNVSPRSNIGFSGQLPNVQPRAVFTQFGQQKTGGPPWEYNGQLYHSKSDLYIGILVDKTAEQFGLKDIAALAGVLAGQPFLPKRFNTPGATKGTSIASKYLSKIPGKLPIGLPQITGVPNALGGQGMRIALTKSIGRFIGRAVPVVGWAVLAYDVGATLYKTQVEFNRITSE